MIEIWDYDKVNQDDFLGRIVVPLCNIPPGKNEEVTYPITRKGNKDVVHGTLKVKLTLHLHGETVSAFLVDVETKGYRFVCLLVY